MSHFKSDIILRSHLNHGYAEDVKHLFPSIDTSERYEIIYSLGILYFYVPYRSAFHSDNSDIFTWVRQYIVEEFLDVLKCSNEIKVVWKLKYGIILPITLKEMI